MTRQRQGIARRLGLAALVLALVSCGGESGEQPPGKMELETEDVGPAPDAGLSTELDERAKVLGPAVAGVLPPGFPADLPLPVPSSLVDFGETPGGRRYVEVDTPSGCSEVARQLTTQLAAAGWRRTGPAEAGGVVYRKAERPVSIRRLERPPGCGIRVEY